MSTLDYLNKTQFDCHLSINQFLPSSRPIIQDYKCPLCSGIYFDPVIDECGHIFCFNCFNNYYKRTSLCPITKSPLKTQATKVLLVTNILDKQTLRCINDIDGCNWIGLLKDLNTHLQYKCQKQKLFCKNEGCFFKATKNELQRHFADCAYKCEECEYCHSSVQGSLMDNHYSKCPLFKVYCPQQCGIKVERQCLNKHIVEMCCNTPLKCKYAKYGCSDSNILRKDIDMRLKEDMGKHIELLCNHIDKMEERIMKLEKCLNVDTNEKINDDIIIKDKNNNINYTDKNGNIININDLTLLNKKRTLNFEDNIKINTKVNSFDMENLSPLISVKGNIATCISNSKSEHCYLFANCHIDTSDCIPFTTWVIKVLTKSSWIGFGLCDKEQVLANNKKFITPNRSTSQHGSFIISSNFYSWNCKEPDENNVVIKFPEIIDNTEIKIAFDNVNKFLLFKIKEEVVKLTKVSPVYKANTKLTPCVIFLNRGDQIEFFGFN